MKGVTVQHLLSIDHWNKILFPKHQHPVLWRGRSRHRTNKQYRGTLGSSRVLRVSGVETLCVCATSEAPSDRVGPHLDTLKMLHEAVAKPQPKPIISEDSGSIVEYLTHLFAGRDAAMTPYLLELRSSR